MVHRRFSLVLQPVLKPESSARGLEYWLEYQDSRQRGSSEATRGWSRARGWSCLNSVTPM